MSRLSGLWKNSDFVQNLGKSDWRWDWIKWNFMGAPPGWCTPGRTLLGSTLCSSVIILKCSFNGNNVKLKWLTTEPAGTKFSHIKYNWNQSQHVGWIQAAEENTATFLYTRSNCPTILTLLAPKPDLSHSLKVCKKHSGAGEGLDSNVRHWLRICLNLVVSPQRGLLMEAV